MTLLSGRIVQSISGFYYVEAAEGLFECKAKGSFRNKKISPLVGDTVVFELNGEKGVISEIKDRKNYLMRPPVANIDILFIVASVDDPKPNLYVIDKLSAFSVFHGIEPVIVFSKCDLASPEEFLSVYKKSGMKTLCCSAQSREGTDEIKELIKGKICAFTGNSGVGKSSILNILDPALLLPTNAISNKLGRGRHTTRSVSLYRIGEGFIADTPGFSSLDFENTTERIYKDELADCFPEFAEYTDKCKFGVSCSHVTDKGCGVLKAVSDGLISEKRHESYIRLYEEVKNFKKWE
ncbi:MAG: ribosome small subunit-dependent GTPase A [Clostridia bacterium]|nr:ribosome small subunit-dependent GTPase A [Clostridia bacterium]